MNWAEVDPAEYIMVCHDCQQATGDYYMTTAEIWAEYGCGRGFLCLACLRQRMGLSWEQLDLFDPAR